MKANLLERNSLSWSNWNHWIQKITRQRKRWEEVENIVWRDPKDMDHIGCDLRETRQRHTQYCLLLPLHEKREHETRYELFWQIDRGNAKHVSIFLLQKRSEESSAK